LPRAPTGEQLAVRGKQGRDTDFTDSPDHSSKPDQLNAEGFINRSRPRSSYLVLEKITRSREDRITTKDPKGTKERDPSATANGRTSTRITGGLGPQMTQIFADSKKPICGHLWNLRINSGGDYLGALTSATTHARP